MYMQLIIYSISLLIAILTFEMFIIKKVNNRDNRFLPAIICTITLYEICRILSIIKPDSSGALRVLEDFALLQFVYMIIPYMWDFYSIEWNALVRTILLLIVLITDAYILFAEVLDYNYTTMFLVAVSAGLLIDFAIWVRVSFRKGRTNEENFYHKYFGAAIFMPMLGVVWRAIFFETIEFILPILFSISCLMVMYAIEADYLVDQEDLVTANIFETTDLILIILDTECSFVRANDTATKLLPQFIKELKEDPNNHQFLDIVRHYVKVGSKVEAFDIDGKYYETKITPVYLKSKARGFIITLFDVTNVAEKANRFLSEKKKAEAEVLMKSRFLARMSHSLRSPLHTIIGLSDILLVKKGINRKNKDLIFHMKSAAGTLLTDVNEILEYSKLESGGVKLNEEEYDFYDVIEDIAYQALININSRPVDLTLEYKSRYPVVVKGDKLKVRDMIQNIVSNAVKFTEKGTIDISVDVFKMTEDDVRIEVEVRDTGVGMTEEQLRYAFDEYESYADIHAVEGTGLGLSIVQLYAQMMGGNASIASNGNEGVVTTIAFIQKDAHVAVREPEIIDRKKLMGQHYNANINQNIQYIYPDAKVLVADDFEVNILIFEEIVKPWGLSVVAVKNGKEAVDAVKKEKFDLIVLDQMMPVMTGSEAAEQIRKLTDTPVIVMTAMQDEDQTNIELFDAKVSKPVEPISFRETMERLLPEEKRVPNKLEAQADSFDSLMEGRIKVLKSFVSETESILQDLPNLKETDMDTFRTKVHGIKGTLRQIGRKEISDDAEIMEMAAKSNHKEFIDRHLNEFIEIISEEIDDIKEKIRRDDTDSEGTVVEISEEEKNKYFETLREAFRTYDLDTIDLMIDKLMHVSLSDKEKNIYEKAKEYADGLEYEKGYELLK